MNDYIKIPMDIEKRSLEIIEEEMGPHNFTKQELLIVKRVIHTTADFEFKNILYIRDGAIEKALDILKKGTVIYADTNMVASGINKSALSKLGCSTRCFISEDEVAKTAKLRCITRSMAAVEKACEEGVKFFVFGNAPTALLRLKELTLEGKASPEFIVGSPVGFVGAAESKKQIEELSLPMITVRGRKGGSNVAAAIVNALLYMIYDRG